MKNLFTADSFPNPSTGNTISGNNAGDAMLEETGSTDATGKLVEIFYKSLLGGYKWAPIVSRKFGRRPPGLLFICFPKV
jgi:hypothetical protein